MHPLFVYCTCTCNWDLEYLICLPPGAAYHNLSHNSFSRLGIPCFRTLPCPRVAHIYLDAIVGHLSLVESKSYYTLRRPIHILKFTCTLEIVWDFLE